MVLVDLTPMEVYRTITHCDDYVDDIFMCTMLLYNNIILRGYDAIIITVFRIYRLYIIYYIISLNSCKTCIMLWKLNHFIMSYAHIQFMVSDIVVYCTKFL